MIKTRSSGTAHEGSLQQLVVTGGGGCGEGGGERGNNACVGDADSSGETVLSGEMRQKVVVTVVMKGKRW